MVDVFLSLIGHPKPNPSPAPAKVFEALAAMSGSSNERFDPDPERDDIMKRINKVSGVWILFRVLFFSLGV